MALGGHMMCITSSAFVIPSIIVFVQVFFNADPPSNWDVQLKFILKNSSFSLNNLHSSCSVHMNFLPSYTNLLKNFQALGKLDA